MPLPYADVYPPLVERSLSLGGGGAHHHSDRNSLAHPYAFPGDVDVEQLVDRVRSVGVCVEPVM